MGVLTPRARVVSDTMISIVILSISYLCAVKSENVLDGLHKLMTPDELGHYFSVDSSHSVPNYEVVYIDHGQHSKAAHKPDHKHMAFNALGEKYNLHLEVNENLVSPGMDVVQVHYNTSTRIPLNFNTRCHYLLRPDHEGVSAAISYCKPGKIHGLVFGRNSSIFSVRPLTHRLHTSLQNAGIDDRMRSGLHIVTPEQLSQAARNHLAQGLEITIKEMELFL